MAWSGQVLFERCYFQGSRQSNIKLGKDGFPGNVKGGQNLTVAETNSAHSSGLGEILTSKQRRQGGRIDFELAKRWNGQN